MKWMISGRDIMHMNNVDRLFGEVQMKWMDARYAIVERFNSHR